VSKLWRATNRAKDKEKGCATRGNENKWVGRINGGDGGNRRWLRCLLGEANQRPKEGAW